MAIDSDDIVYKLKDYVKPDFKESGIVLSYSNGSWFLPDHYSIDVDAIRKSRIMRSSGSDEPSTGLFKKVLKLLIDEDLVTIECKTGINIQSISWELFQTFLSAGLKSSTNYLSETVVIRPKADELELINTLNEVVISVSRPLFSEIMRSPVQEKFSGLIALQFFDPPAENVEEVLSKANHIVNSRNLEPKKDPDYKLKLPWIGKAHVTHFRDDDFIKTLKNRRSWVASDADQKPALDELKELLALTYGAQTSSSGVTTFFVPSPGKGYSVRIFVIYPQSNGSELYEYNPLSGSLDLKQKSPELPGNHAGIRVLCVGDATELNRKYNLISYRLMLLEAGALLHQISLVTSYLNLQGKIIGYTNEKSLKQRFQNCFSPSQKMLGEFVLTKAAQGTRT